MEWRRMRMRRRRRKVYSKQAMNEVDAGRDRATGDLRSARRSRTVGGGCIPNSKDACILRL
jgi:hypothetical protein